MHTHTLLKRENANEDEANDLDVDGESYVLYSQRPTKGPFFSFQELAPAQTTTQTRQTSQITERKTRASRDENIEFEFDTNVFEPCARTAQILPLGVWLQQKRRMFDVKQRLRCRFGMCADDGACVCSSVESV